MTNEALAGIQADIEKKTTERKRYEEDASPRRPAAFANNLIQQDPRSRWSPIIEALAKEQRPRARPRYAMSSGVVTASPTIDITDEVVRRYDAGQGGDASRQEVTPSRPLKLRRENGLAPLSPFCLARTPLRRRRSKVIAGSGRPRPGCRSRTGGPQVPAPLVDVELRSALPQVTPVELVDQAVDEADREELPVVSVPRDLEGRAGLTRPLRGGAGWWSRTTTGRSAPRPLPDRMPGMDRRTSWTAERARVPPPDEPDGPGHLRGLVLQDRDAAGRGDRPGSSRGRCTNSWLPGAGVDRRGAHGAAA
ncbi:MAG: hypothetical protein M0C28_38745 [Candidatus Moduliflexus flocculans]|nr:hypothetical protein [Candidatus Moduliflexus flocculans]